MNNTTYRQEEQNSTEDIGARTPEFTPAARMVEEALMMCVDPRTGLIRSIAIIDLEVATGMKERRIRRAIDRLVELHRLEKIRHNGKENDYRMLVPVPPGTRRVLGFADRRPVRKEPVTPVAFNPVDVSTFRRGLDVERTYDAEEQKKMHPVPEAPPLPSQTMESITPPDVPAEVSERFRKAKEEKQRDHNWKMWEADLARLKANNPERRPWVRVPIPPPPSGHRFEVDDIEAIKQRIASGLDPVPEGPQPSPPSDPAMGSGVDAVPRPMYGAPHGEHEGSIEHRQHPQRCGREA